MQRPTGPYALLVLQLELMRQEVDDSEYEAGSLSDYLDRGRPDEGQRRDAEAGMARWQARARDALARLSDRLRTVRATTPAAVQQWADWHIAILHRILAETAGAPPEERGRISDASVRRHIAQQTLAEWQQVRQGTLDFVRINGYFLKEYREGVREAVRA